MFSTKLLDILNNNLSKFGEKPLIWYYYKTYWYENDSKRVKNFFLLIMMHCI